MAAVLLLTLGLSGCASQSREAAGVAMAGDFATCVERVHVETELAMQLTQSATAAMQDVVAGQTRSDPVAAFKGLTSALGAFERQADQLEASVRSMRAAALKVFEQWTTDLQLIEDTKLRERSEQRMDAAWKRYQALLAASRAAENGAEAYHKSLRDLSLFLGNDLSAAAIADVRDDASAIARQTDDLDARYRRTLAAARDYLATAALAKEATPAQQPQHAAPASPEAEPARRPPARPR